MEKIGSRPVSNSMFRPRVCMDRTSAIQIDDFAGVICVETVVRVRERRARPSVAGVDRQTDRRTDRSTVAGWLSKPWTLR